MVRENWPLPERTGQTMSGILNAPCRAVRRFAAGGPAAQLNPLAALSLLFARIILRKGIKLFTGNPTIRMNRHSP